MYRYACSRDNDPVCDSAFDLKLTVVHSKYIFYGPVIFLFCLRLFDVQTGLL